MSRCTRCTTVWETAAHTRGFGKPQTLVHLVHLAALGIVLRALLIEFGTESHPLVNPRPGRDGLGPQPRRTGDPLRVHDLQPLNPVPSRLFMLHEPGSK